MGDERGSEAPRLLNINVGVLGHVDSGKTSLGEARLELCLACNCNFACGWWPW